MKAGAISLLFTNTSLGSSGCSVNTYLVSTPAPLKPICHLADRHDTCFQGSSLIPFYFYGESSKIFISCLSSISLDGCREQEATFTPNAFLPQMGLW